MNPHVRSLSAALALVIVTAAYLVFQARIDAAGTAAPGARTLRCAPDRAASRPGHGARHPRSARGPGPTEGTRSSGSRRSTGLWTREISGLTAMIHEAEREFSVFARDAQGTRGASLPEIQRRSATFSQLSAELQRAPPAPLRRGIARAGGVAASTAGPVEGAGHREESDETERIERETRRGRP